MADLSKPANPASLMHRLGHTLHTHIPAIWMRFVLALVGLVLAFGAALFSNVSRESGNFWATLILASAALLLAAIVGLTTVPYLARQVATARLREAFHYDVTRFGLFYFLLILVIGIAALNTGNNLLYFIDAVMLSAILASGIASATVLRHLELDVRLPEHVFAGRPALARLIVRNPRRWIPAFSVNVLSFAKKSPGKHWHWMHADFGFPPGRSKERRWLTLPDRELRRVMDAPAPPNIFDGSAYFPYIPAQRELIAEVQLHFQRRGLYQQDTFGLSTRFPFAFLTKTRRLPLLREIVVYPSVEPPDEFFEVLPMITGEFEIFVRGRGYDLYRIREYMPEDSARHVDWKASAKSGSLKVREFSREDERKLRIIFDNPVPGAVSSPVYENAVALAASLAWHFAEENSEVSFVAQNYAGAPDIYQFLRFLATVEPQSGPSVIDHLQVSDDYNVILTTRHRGSIPTPLWASSYFIFIGARQ